MDERSVDVVVVGFGAAGISAAITAHDAGREVLVLEKMPKEHAGGNSRVSGQVWFSPTDIDGAKRHLRAMCGDYSIDENVVDAWARETSGNEAWLRDRAQEVRGRVPRDAGDPYDGDSTDFVEVSWGDVLRAQGVTDPPEYEYHDVDGYDCGTQYHMIGGTMGFSRLWLMLATCLAERRIPVEYETAATQLLRDSSGRITGVIASGPSGDQAVNAGRGVVLASGGFAANREMARNFLRLPNVTPWGSPACTGDGIKLAQAVGADLAHPYNYMSSPGIALPPYPTGEDAMPRGKSFINVGRNGRRFVDETLRNRHSKERLRGDYDFNPGVPMWTVFDEASRRAGPLVIPRSFFPVGWLKQVEGYEWSMDNLAEIDKGWVAKADTIRELAEQLGVDPDGLESEVERFNELATSGEDDPFHGRPAATMASISEPPYYGYEWAQLLITTLGGIRKDGDARAIDPYGEPIEGLFCAGDVSSTYSWCLSGGMGLGDALAFGRIAGRQAAMAS